VIAEGGLIVGANGSIASADAYLNDYYLVSAAVHRQAACEVMGVALGLGDNSSRSGCMYWVNPSDSVLTSQQYPSSDDFNLLHAIYPF
jgi:hypothetical protein